MARRFGALCLVLGLCGGGPARAADALVTGLDHVPIAVRDLDAAAADFRRLGFTLKPGRVHEDGIRNVHAKFRDGTELELITAPAAVDATTRAYVEMQQEGEGGAYAGLYAPDRDALLARLATLAPGYRPAGMLVMLPEDAPGSYLFFGPRNASPTDRAEHFVHANGADGLRGVWLALDDAASARSLLAGLGAEPATETACTPDCAPFPAARFAAGAVTFLPASALRLPGRPVVGAVVITRDFAALLRTLAASGVQAAVHGPRGRRRALLAPQVTHGLWLEFREEPGRLSPGATPGAPRAP